MAMRIAAMTILLISVFLACTNTVKQEDLYGRWKYIKVASSNPEDSVTAAELSEQAPAIILSKDDRLVIEWGGKRLSHGNFRMEGNMIRYTETLEGNRTREFPFLITKLTDKELVFQTMEQKFTTVTARKSNE